MKDNQTLDELLDELRDKHGIDVRALQKNAASNEKIKGLMKESKVS